MAMMKKAVHRVKRGEEPSNHRQTLPAIKKRGEESSYKPEPLPAIVKRGEKASNPIREFKKTATPRTTSGLGSKVKKPLTVTSGTKMKKTLTKRK